MKLAYRMEKRFVIGLLAMMMLSAIPAAHAAQQVWLSNLDLTKMYQGYGKPQVNRSIREKPLTIAGRTFENGVGTHAASELWVDLGGGCDRFQAWVGLDDAAGPGSVTFTVIGDNTDLYNSGVMKGGMPAKRVDVDLKGVKLLTLMVEDGGDSINYDHGDWADARFVVSGAAPKAVSGPAPEEALILTPKPGLAPRVNGPTVYGCRPGHPFIYRIPVQGRRPMTFAAAGLPASLKLDAATGIITGSAPEKGEYKVTLSARNGQGEFSRPFKIVSGDKLALTPPMGWNDWYAHTSHITDKLMREAADVMIERGMADVGYSYVNIDDCWMNVPQNKDVPDYKRRTDPNRVGPGRDANGNIVPNQYFPDMKGLTDYIHAKGLKAGLYTSPGPLTCAGYEGAWQHEAQDARQFADWGFDFLKHDWCSYGRIAPKKPSLEDYKKPYRLMGELLKKQDRDIVLNLCQYGMGNVWEWGAEVGGHCWRTAGDLGAGGTLRSFFEVALRNAEHKAYSKPGEWNDPDYLMIGYKGEALGGQRFDLSPNESYAYMSLWCLMAAPLFYSGDMSRLDDFTLNVLCNPEVIEVDQDPLGKSADVHMITPKLFIMAKEMEDGSKAVGLFNRGRIPAKVAASWDKLGVSGKQLVRDLWRQKDLGTYEGRFEAEVSQRGVVMIRVRPAAR